MIDSDTITKAVREHAIKNYDNGGWDFVVECWTDSDIVEASTGAETVEDAIRLVGECVGVTNDYRNEVRSEIF